MSISATTPLRAYALASLITVALGAVAMQLGDIPLGVWIRNPIAWVAAAIVSLALIRAKPFWAWTAPLALVVIALSLLGPDQEGVHRWLGFGPIQLNAAALVLPAAIGAFALNRPVIALVSFALIAVILAWQPDISQLAGFAPAAFILCAARFGWKGAVGAAILGTSAIAFCLSLPDPLQPVFHVEGIFLMANEVNPAMAAVMALSLAAAALSPLLFWKDASSKNTGLRWPASALAAYFAITALTPLFGAYPVPLAGYGLSFVIGWWLGLGALCAQGTKAVRH